MPAFEPGDRIGGEFKVLDVFGGEGRSGMGVVYLVTHREHPAPFVLKTYQRALDDGAKRQFLKETQAWITAGASPHIVQAFWVREIDRQLYVAAEYVAPDSEGRNSLHDFLDRGAQRIEVVLTWAAHFCFGMEYAKSRGVSAHRDIKPANLMVDRAVGLKVTDFGLAKAIDVDHAPSQPGLRSAGRASVTSTGSAMGTWPYMAPEQWLDAKTADHRADIYSFGIVLYQLITGGRFPFRVAGAETHPEAAFFDAHLRQALVAVESPLMPVIARCLEKQPAARYASYDEMLKELSQIASRLKIRLPKATFVDKEAEELYAQAQSFVALGDKERALRVINEYTRKFPGNCCGWTEKGKIHLERGEYPEGIAATKKALELDPYNTHDWNNLGVLMGRVGAQLDDVASAFDSALRFDPDNTGAMMNFVAALSTRRTELDRAAELAARALRLRPEKEIVKINSQGLLQTCLAAQALPALETLLSAWTEARPDDLDAWHNRGCVALDRQQLDVALECFTEVHQRAPDDNFAILQLAKLWFMKKKARECLHFCDLLMQRHHKMDVAVGMKARILNFVAGLQPALDFLMPYIQNNPTNGSLLMILAEIYEYRDRYPAAIETLQRAKQLRRQRGGDLEQDLALIDAKLQHLVRIGRGG